MKILAFTDLHASLIGLKALKKKVENRNPDLIVAAGDMTVFTDNIEWVMGKIAKLKKPTLVIPGNHEEGYPLSTVCKRHDNLIYLHKRTFVKDDILFIGHGGGGFSFEFPDFENFVKRIKDKIHQHKKIILITHQSPYKTKTDMIFDGRHVGSKTYRRFIQKYNSKIKLNICGHIHECQRKFDTLGKTKIINPGPNGVIIRVEL